MSWWTDIRDGVSHVGHHVSHAIKHFDTVLRSHNAPDFYIGGSYKYGTDEFTNNSVIGDNPTNHNIPSQGPTYSTPIGNMPKAYKANVAGTASSIKQGGMTKDELIEFNQKHPNETALRR